MGHFHIHFKFNPAYFEKKILLKGKILAVKLR